MMADKCVACGLDVYDGGELCPICQDDPPPGYGENGLSAGVHVCTDKERTELQQAALSAIAEHGGVVAAARALDCNHGIIALARDGKDFPKARKVLGLPPKTVPVEPCADCGEVHETKATCPHELAKQRSGPKRFRIHYEAGRGEYGRKRRDKVQSWLGRNGYDNLTQAIDELMESE